MSNTRNGLLAQIVQASGGTVTDASNRNSLLQDWLNAVSGPVGRWYFTANGIDQYIELNSQISFLDGDIVSFKISKPTADFDTVFDGFNRAFRLRSGSGGVIQLSGFSGTVNGQPIVSDSTIWPDGISEFVLTKSGSSADYITRLLCRSDSPVNQFGGRIYDFKVNDGSVYNFPLDDSFANNPVARNTGSGANATYINATEASWSYEVPQPKRWYFTGNGVDQRIDFASDQVFSGDFWIEAYVNMNSNGFHLTAKGDNNRIAFTSNGSLVVTVSGVQGVSDANSGILDNQIHKLRLMRLADGTYSYSVDDVLQTQTTFVTGDLSVLSLAGGYTGFTSIPSLAGRIYNYSDSLGNVLPLDDGPNNTSARNTGSGPNGFYVNDTEASWSYE